MKRRILAFLLALTLLPLPALASQALGWELYQTDTVLGPGLTVSSQVLWGDSRQDYRREQYAVYTPGQGAEPLVCYSSAVPSTATLTAMAKGLEEYGYRVLAGANGDYFVLSTGVPLGLVVSYGVLRSSSSYHYAVGFTEAGRAFVGKPELSITATFHGYDLTVAGGYNKTREAKGGYFLYSADFGASTRASGSGVNVVLRPVTVPAGYREPEKPAPAPEAPTPPEGLDVDALWAAIEGRPDEDGEVRAVSDEELEALNAWELTRAQYAEDLAAWEEAMETWKAALLASAATLADAEGNLTIGERTDFVVESVSAHSGAAAIPQGRLVLSVGTASSAFLVDEVKALVPGERLSVTVTSPDARWKSAYSALGAYAHIVQNGAVADGLDQSADPRTALGIKPDGTVLLYTVDGRRAGHSVGASVRQVAARLIELGCTEAVLFDGGGSTSFGVTAPLDSAFSLQNRPSEGGQRAVTDALFFVSRLRATGELGSVYVEPQSALMLSGARQSLTGYGVDTNYHPMNTGALAGLSYTVAGPGWMEGDTFLAGAEKGVATVTARTASGKTGTARMTVVDTPDTITLTDAGGKAVTALNLDPGQTASLNAAAGWYKLPLLADDTCFTWTLPEALGSVDPYGNLTAGKSAGSGRLTVTAGEKSVSIPVTVGGHIKLLEDFEGEDVTWPGLPGDGILPATGESTADIAARGKKALAVNYPGAYPVCMAVEAPIEAGESYLGCWLMGSGDAVRLEAALRLAGGDETSVVLADEGFAGWRQVLVPIPEDTAALVSLTVTPTAGRGGTLFLDHLVSANGPLFDATAPTVKLSVKEGAVSATLSDNVDKTFDAANIALTLDGWRMDFALAGSKLTASIPTDSLLHRVSLTVRDVSGNLTRQSVELPARGERDLPFTDVAGHWAKDHIVFLYDQGVTNGRLTDAGRVFDADTNVTRGEFAAMLARWQRADLAGYERVALPFVDASDIPAWALGAVGYLYETGVMAGSLEEDGLYANANDPITRAQAMTMLGRIQQRGYTPAAEVFADHADIPAWAEEHVYTLAGQGVVSGYEGLVRPLDPITRGEVAKLLTTLW